MGPLKKNKLQKASNILWKTSLYTPGSCKLNELIRLSHKRLRRAHVTHQNNLFTSSKSFRVATRILIRGVKSYLFSLNSSGMRAGWEACSSWRRVHEHSSMNAARRPGWQHELKDWYNQPFSSKRMLPVLSRFIRNTLSHATLSDIMSCHSIFGFSCSDVQGRAEIFISAFCKTFFLCFTCFLTRTKACRLRYEPTETPSYFSTQFSLHVSLFQPCPVVCKEVALDEMMCALHS